MFHSDLLGMLAFHAQALWHQAERRMLMGSIVCFTAGFLVYVLVRNRIYAVLPEIISLKLGPLQYLLDLEFLQTLLFLLIVYIPALVLLSNAISADGPGLSISKQEYRLHVSSLLPLWGVLFLLAAPIQWIVPHFLIIWVFEISIGYLLRSFLLVVYTVWAVKQLNCLTMTQAIGVFLLSWITLPVFFFMNYNLIVTASFALIPLIVWSRRRVRDYGISRVDEANIQKYHISLAANPEESDVWYRLGLIYLRRGNPDEAVRQFAEARRIDPGNPDYVYYLGRAYEMKGELDRALECYEKVYGIDPEYESGAVGRELGKSYVHCGSVERGTELLSQFLKKRNTDPEGRYWMAVALKKAGNMSQMIGELNLMMEQVRSDSRLLKSGGRQWVLRSRHLLRQTRRSSGFGAAERDI